MATELKNMVQSKVCMPINCNIVIKDNAVVYCFCNKYSDR